jgi:hypothetical protein
VSNLKEMAREPWHLVARFFTSLSAHPPSIRSELWAEQHLSSSERKLWIQLSNQDRRHSAGVARKFAEVRPSVTTAEIVGALLHDVGKIECHLGTFRRVIATIVGPRTTNFRAYHEHEEIGARLAMAAGSAPATVELIAGRGPAFPDLESVDR